MTSNSTGTVTFLFTDIQGSTRLAREYAERWEKVCSHYHEILREAIERYNGFVFQIFGDAFCAAFHKAGDVLKAAIIAQEGLECELRGDAAVRVRMGIHTGETEIDGKEYRGYPTLSFVQRVMSAGHGGQILVSRVIENLLREPLLKQISLLDMGIHKFTGTMNPVRSCAQIATRAKDKGLV